jgi:hypothetical protein
VSIGDKHERSHRAGASSAWTESWEFRVAAPDLSVAVVITVVRRPAEGKVSYFGVLCGRGRPTIAVVEHDIGPPRGGLEIRSSGIWADHVCERPHEHWSVGLEAFGLALDEPDDLVTSGRGLLVPLGFDLEWETPEPPERIEGAGEEGYLTVGAAHGEILLGEGSLAIDGPGHRLHRWGTGPALAEWWSLPGTAGFGPPPAVLADVVRLDLPDHGGTVTSLSLGHHLTPDGPGAGGWVSARAAAPDPSAS